MDDNKPATTPQAPLPNQAPTPMPAATPPPPEASSTEPAKEANTGSTVVSPKSSGGIKSKLPILLIVTLLLIILAAVGIFFWKNMMTKNEPAPAQEEAQEDVEETPTIEPTAATSSSKLDQTFTSEKLPQLSFMGYSLMYPADWTLSEQRSETTTPNSTVTLTKNGYVLKIYQAATGGAGCIYEGDVPIGPFSDYRINEYTDIVTSFATLRQTETPSNGKMSYSYCQKSSTEDSYGAPTSIGHVSLTTGVANSDPEIMSEIEEIVKSIKTL